ncbi:MAG: class I SAM-dependent methyltransferase [Fibrobacteria bacterium]|nr:class I SAM-dependent methyltransferase [Fibrobacteria bacterium]
MKTKELLKKAEKPALYKKGSAFMWSDPYISKNLLDVHLSEEVDLASRKASTIDSTVEWIDKRIGGDNLRILDLGCGPGLYAERLAKLGHKVTGVDISANSIEYARGQAQDKGLSIDYINKDYLELSLEDDAFDAAICIYTDLGVLLPEDRSIWLNNVKRMLKPGGVLIFDLMSDNQLEEKLTPKTWDVSEKGFWGEGVCLQLSESFLYPVEKVILYQHVIAEDDAVKTYRFWTHFFSKDDLRKMLEEKGFKIVSIDNNVLPATGHYDGSNVWFCCCIA